jgi:hypothetical protein
LFYQLAINQKKWSLIKPDFMVGSCFTIFATLLFIYLSK